MEYATGGDLHKYLQKNFTNITWNKEKLYILYQISEGLETIHEKKFVHRDFHSGNIVLFKSNKSNNCDEWKIGDLGLSRAVNSKSSNHEICGVIPYIAPEIFKGSEFSKEADIYSFGGNYTSRSLSALISKISSFYSLTISFNSSHISKLESYNTDIIKSLSSQNLNFAIQKFSTSLNSSYISEELEFDINTESLTSQDLNSTIRNYSTTLDSNYISAELEFDINTKSFLSQNLSCTNQNFSTSLKKRRNEELLNVENYDNSGKRIKTSFNYLLK
ncbi:unnamed protein product [Rhizophagus irregularis]|nr:unnamed protein product [Rhizophagus irregularis]